MLTVLTEYLDSIRNSLRLNLTAEKEVIDELTKIKGIGKAKAETLYRTGFDSLEKLKKASVKEFEKIDGITEILAKEIVEKFQEQSKTKKEETKKEESSQDKPKKQEEIKEEKDKDDKNEKTEEKTDSKENENKTKGD